MYSFEIEVYEQSQLPQFKIKTDSHDDTKITLKEKKEREENCSSRTKVI